MLGSTDSPEFLTISTNSDTLQSGVLYGICFLFHFPAVPADTSKRLDAKSASVSFVAQPKILNTVQIHLLHGKREERKVTNSIVPTLYGYNVLFPRQYHPISWPNLCFLIKKLHK
jgi:hypothetical protein